MSGPPISDEDQARIEVQGQRRRLLEGRWMVDALDRQVAFYSAESRSHLPAPDLSRNPLLEIVTQLQLYDDRPTIRAEAAKPEDMARLVPGTWAPIMADRLKHQVGVNESLVRVDITGEPEAGRRRLTYRVVYADTVTELVRDPKDDRLVVALRERRMRTRPQTNQSECTWETWDITTAPPTFRIEAERKLNGASQSTLVDVTEEYTGSLAYPYEYQGAPVCPYILAHARLGAHTWDCDSGAEVVSGTLTGSALMTMWVGGVRDTSNPPVYVRDLEILVQGATNKLQGSTSVVRMDGSTVLQTRSMSTTTAGEIGRLAAGADPKASMEAIELYFAGLAASFGITGDDVSRGVGASGYAIVLSRAGQRRARKRLEGPCSVADQVTLATGAKLLNAYGGTSLPTDPDDYAVAYKQVDLSPEDVTALLAETKELLALGLITQRMALKRHHPSLDDKELDTLAAEIEAEKAKKRPPMGAPPPFGKPAEEAQEKPKPEEPEPEKPKEEEDE